MNRIIDAIIYVIKSFGDALIINSTNYDAVKLMTIICILQSFAIFFLMVKLNINNLTGDEKNGKKEKT